MDKVMSHIRSKNIILIIILLITVSFNSCKKTDTDKEWESKLRGFWVPVNNNDVVYESMPSFVFEGGNKGWSFLDDTTRHDVFKWEIKRKQLKLYYDRAPSYDIGEDKYNSKALIKINSFEEGKMSVSQFSYGGYQKDYYLKKQDITDLISTE